MISLVPRRIGSAAEKVSRFRFMWTQVERSGNTLMRLKRDVRLRISSKGRLEVYCRNARYRRCSACRPFGSGRSSRVAAGFYVSPSCAPPLRYDRSHDRIAPMSSVFMIFARSLTGIVGVTDRTSLCIASETCIAISSFSNNDNHRFPRCGPCSIDAGQCMNEAKHSIG